MSLKCFKVQKSNYKGLSATLSMIAGGGVRYHCFDLDVDYLVLVDEST